MKNILSALALVFVGFLLFLFTIAPAWLADLVIRSVLSIGSSGPAVKMSVGAVMFFATLLAEMFVFGYGLKWLVERKQPCK